MRINWDTPIDELYHGDNIAYIDLDEDEICHWKYIKREKLANGKWRYYYDQSELDELERNMINAKSRHGDAARRLSNAKINEKLRSDMYKRSNRGEEKTRNGNAWLKADASLKAATKNYNKTLKAAEKAEKKYRTNKIITFPARTISKGAVTVANFFSGANRKPKTNTKKK